jgi:hypothetical protein
MLPSESLNPTALAKSWRTGETLGSENRRSFYRHHQFLPMVSPPHNLIYHPTLAPEHDEPFFIYRHYQRNKERISQQRRSIKTQAKRSDHLEESTTIVIDHPIGTAASIIFYRERQDAPVHAIAAEIWQGNRKVLNVKPMHCLGLSPSQVVGMMTCGRIYICGLSSLTMTTCIWSRSITTQRNGSR